MHQNKKASKADLKLSTIGCLTATAGLLASQHCDVMPPFIV